MTAIRRIIALTIFTIPAIAAAHTGEDAGAHHTAETVVLFAVAAAVIGGAWYAIKRRNG